MKLALIAKIAIAVAIVLCAGTLITSLQTPLVLPIALVYGIAAWTMFRREAWGGYGLALFSAACAIGPALSASLSGALILLAFAALFALAGRSLSEPGARFPWIAVAAFTAAFFTTFQPFMMPTGSMEETIQIGDHLLVNRFATEPARGEMIVHLYPPDRRQTFIKRVIGMPGDRIHFESKKLFVNGVLVHEPYAVHNTDYVDAYRDNFPSGHVQFTPIAAGAQMLSNNIVNGEVVVPQGKYFVLGDNRDSSLDSRYWGFVDKSDIKGKPAFVYHRK